MWIALTCSLKHHAHIHLYIHTQACAHVRPCTGSHVGVHTPFSHSLPRQGPASFMASPCCPHSSPLLLLEVGTSYYAVAVVKRSSNVTINTLKGVRSCHTGINRTVGWNVPVGYLVTKFSRQPLPRSYLPLLCNQAKIVKNFQNVEKRGDCFH